MPGAPGARRANIPSMTCFYAARIALFRRCGLCCGFCCGFCCGLCVMHYLVVYVARDVVVRVVVRDAPASCCRSCSCCVSCCNPVAFCCLSRTCLRRDDPPPQVCPAESREPLRERDDVLDPEHHHRHPRPMDRVRSLCGGLKAPVGAPGHGRGRGPRRPTDAAGAHGHCTGTGLRHPTTAHRPHDRRE